MAYSTAVCSAVLVGSFEVAQAEGETCHGQPATIVGKPGADVEGTEGPDVVVTNGALRTSTLGGDDLVCVTGGADLEDWDTPHVQVEEGNDEVDGTATQTEHLFVDLGPGDDRFTGGPAGDGVGAADHWDVSGSPDAGTDTVMTGAGNDNVTTGGRWSAPDRDDIDLGPGADYVTLQGAIDPAHPVFGGDGSDQIELTRGALRHALVLDNAVGQARRAGVVVMAWSGFERFRITSIGPWEPPSFIGGSGGESVKTYVPLTSADMGGGDDRLNLELQDALVDRASYVGGAGADYVILYAGAGSQAWRVDLDLPRGRLMFQREREGQRVRARVREFERYRLSSVRLDVRGSAGSDHVQWLGCRGVVDGGPGKDLIEEFSMADAGCGYGGVEATEVVRGGRGDDTLRGSRYPNVLLGGPGDDVAEGRGNTDRCVAETERSCER